MPVSVVPRAWRQRSGDLFHAPMLRLPFGRARAAPPAKMTARRVMKEEAMKEYRGWLAAAVVFAFVAAAASPASAQARGERRGSAHFREPRNSFEHSDPEVHEWKESAAALRCQRRNQVGRSEALPVDDRPAAGISERGAHLRQISAREPSGRKD